LYSYFLWLARGIIQQKCARIGLRSTKIAWLSRKRALILTFYEKIENDDWQFKIKDTFQKAILIFSQFNHQKNIFEKISIWVVKYAECYADFKSQ